MLIMILFHSGGYRCFKHFYQEYVCKHLAHLFSRRVSYNRFVELEKEVLFPLTIFIKTLHLIINDKGEILNFMFTTTDVDGREPLKQESLLDNIKGKLCADKG